MAIPAALTDDEIEFVSSIARQAGNLAMNLRAGVSVTEKAAGDFVTEADLACGKLIVDSLKERFPLDAIICEEDVTHEQGAFLRDGETKRIWVIDPIDGTENYIADDNMYSVMIGLLIDGQPAYGWVFSPSVDALYVACPNRPTTKKTGLTCTELVSVCRFLDNTTIRLLMGNRDRRQHNYVEMIPNIEFLYSGSVGLRVAMILEGRADAYLHLAGKLKIWDTVAPVAMALSAGLDVGSLERDELDYTSIVHEHPVIIGKPGTVTRLRDNIAAHAAGTRVAPAHSGSIPSL